MLIKLFFSSSACVYGLHANPPCKETDPTGAINPYGNTKFMIEQILTDHQKANPDWSVVILRYFNPIGAHASGLIGEDPNGIPNNLVPYVAQVAIGKLPCLSVFGNDYKTHDGTGVRDYIHVVDLAKGHVNAVDYCLTHPGTEVFNLGTGTGYSVLDVIKAFEKASGVKINYKITERRPGDADAVFSDPSKAKQFLGWEAKLGLDKMCEDQWNFIKLNPNGL